MRASNYLTMAKVVFKPMCHLQPLYVKTVGIMMLLIIFAYKIPLLNLLLWFAIMATNYLKTAKVVSKFMFQLQPQVQNQLFVRKVGIMTLIIMFAFKVTLHHQLH